MKSTPKHNFFEGTIVPVMRSQEQIRQLLLDFDCDGVSWSEIFSQNTIVLTFAKRLEKHFATVRYTVKVPDPNLRGARGGDEIRRRKEQMKRRTYRALFETLRAKFIGIQFETTTFEYEFLAHMVVVDAQGRQVTLGSLLVPQLGNPSMQLAAKSEPHPDDTKTGGADATIHAAVEVSDADEGTFREVEA